MHIHVRFVENHPVIQEKLLFTEIWTEIWTDRQIDHQTDRPLAGQTNDKKQSAEMFAKGKLKLCQCYICTVTTTSML